MSNYISYSNILKDRNNFKKSGTNSGSEFNIFDTPSHKYFKLFFYFNNGDASGSYSIEASNGLLTPTWFIDGIGDENYYMYNSAWSYLKMNDEDDRADLLQDFINLLSNINSESPWYFSEISGLDAALDRKAIHTNNFNVEETRQKITIKCLPDSVDNRIGTLLDLYRTIVWDWTTKREVLPSNLKKFDMGIFIFETPTTPIHNDSFIGEASSGYQTSYKYIELHNCEIDYNSTKNVYNSLNNAEGNINEYNIEIYFDDCFETRYNEFMMSEIGDLIRTDLSYQSKENQSDKNNKELLNRINYYGDSQQVNDELNNKNRFKEKRVVKKIPGKNNFISNAVGQLVNLGVDYVSGIVKKAVLGNLYTFSLTRLSKQAKGLIQGDIISAARHVSEYIRDQDKSKTNQIIKKSNIFQGNITIKTSVKNLGNLAQNNTIANNI